MKRAKLLLLLIIPVVAVAAPLAIARNHAAHAAASTIGVSGKEFKFNLTAGSARRGVIVFRFTNRGTLGHDFKINGKKTPIIQPRKTAVLRITLRPGRYRYLCTVPGHAASGMKGVFTVR
jgi:plastocyanin